MPSRDGNNFGKFTTWTPEICHRHESMGDTPRVTWCTQRPGPGEKFEHKQGSKKPTLQHDQLKESCPRCACPLCVRFPETPKYSHSKKKQPNYNANSWGELWVQTTLNSDIQIFNIPQVLNHRVTEKSTRRLNWWFISSSWLVSSAPCRPDLPPSLRSPEVGASTWSHASPVVQNEKHEKNIQKFDFLRIIFKLTILDWSLQLTSPRVSNTTSKKTPVHFGLVKQPFVELDGPRQRR